MTIFATRSSCETTRCSGCRGWWRWCGQETARQYALEHLDDLLVKPFFRSPGRLPEGSEPLTPDERDELKRRIEFDPDLFVAQERVGFSAAPAWDGSQLVSRPVALR